MKLYAIITLLVGASISTSSALSQESAPIFGTWNHDGTGENITVRRNADVFDSRLGQGRISSTARNAANFVIAYQSNVYCWYYITFTNNGNRMNLARRSSEQSSTKCLSGTFNRESRGPGEPSQPANQPYQVTFSNNGPWIDNSELDDFWASSSTIELVVDGAYQQTHRLSRGFEPFYVNLMPGTHVITYRAKIRIRDGSRIDGSCSATFNIRNVQIIHPYIKFISTDGGHRIHSCGAK